jgi:hypothetical protein
VQRVLLHLGPQQEKNMGFYRENLCVLGAFAAKNISFGIIQGFL